MDAHVNLPVITARIFRKSIETDRHVFHWFLSLVRNPAVKTDLRDVPGVPEVYRRLTIQLWLAALCVAAGVLVLLFVLFTRQYLYLSIGLPLLLAGLIIKNRAGACIAEISLALALKIFGEKNFSQSTLYMISEKLGERYHSKALVEAMISVDSLMRGLMIGTLVVVILVHPLEFWPGLLVLIIVYQTGYFVLNLPVIYRNFIR